MRYLTLPDNNKVTPPSHEGDDDLDGLRFVRLPLCEINRNMQFPFRHVVFEIAEYNFSWLAYVG